MDLKVNHVNVYVCYQDHDDRGNRSVIEFASNEDTAKTTTAKSGWYNTRGTYEKRKALELVYENKTDVYLIDAEHSYPIMLDIMLGDYNEGLKKSGLSKLTVDEKRALGLC